MKQIKVLEDFLEKWEENASIFYKRISKEYISLKDEYDKVPFRYHSYFVSDIPIEYKEIRNKYNNFLNMHKTFINSLYNYSRNNYETAINKYLEKEVSRKRDNFIKKVEKISGEILDVSDLKMSFNMEINGIVIGDKGKVKVNTIFAGGYNIQCLHFRVLVKEVK